MKKLFLLVILLFSFTIVSAYSIELSKEDYYSGETLQAEVHGIDDLKFENIYLYEIKDVKVRNSVIYDFTKTEDMYIIYMILPDKAGNYSLSLKSVLINNVNLGSVESNFTISDTNTSYLSINPGFIITEDDFSVDVKNKGSEKIETKASYEDQEKEVELWPGEEKRIRFDKGKDGEVKIDDYVIDVFVLDEEDEEEEEELIQTGNLKIIPNIVKKDITIGERWRIRFSVINSGEDDIENIEIEYPDKYGIKLDKEEIDLIKGRDLEAVELSLLSEEEEEIEFKLIAKAGEDEAEMLVQINSYEEIEDIKEAEKESISGGNCSEIGGEICEENEECDGTNDYADDGKCCIGECKESGSWKIGWVIVILVLLAVGGFIFLRFKYSKDKTPVDVIKKRAG